MRTVRWLLLIGGVMGLVVGCSTLKTKKTAEVVDDKAICTEIERKLLAETGPPGPFNMDIDSYRGTVTLDGTVASEDQKATVVEIVKGTPGVQQVQSFLQVSKSP
jgi:osmotically-inducible protein OsmY